MKLNRLLLLLVALISATNVRADLAALFTNPPPTAKLKFSRRPSIIFIQCHDLARGDLSCYGQTNYQTPNLDQLAAEGLRFTNYTGGTNSAATTAQLIFGKNSAPGNGEINLAQRLQLNGYHTGLIGEWSLGGLPWTQGFDEFAGFLEDSEGRNYYPDSIWRYAPNTIFTNVVLGKDGTVWWEEGDGEPPSDALDWLGRPWTKDTKDASGKAVAGAHPNSRFTAPFNQCPSASYRLEHHHGVPISAFIFGGRREHLAPLVYESTSWNHGVFVGAGMASERTSAQYGAQGEVRRDPFAMLPFCGYNMADYCGHWLSMAKHTDPAKLPKIFFTNWFRKSADGKWLWPGYGDNIRVLKWVCEQVEGQGRSVQTPIGNLPAPDAIDTTGLNLPAANLQELLRVDLAGWRNEVEDIAKNYEKLGAHIPEALKAQLDKLRARLSQG